MLYVDQKDKFRTMSSGTKGYSSVNIGDKHNSDAVQHLTIYHTVNVVIIIMIIMIIIITLDHS